VFKLATLVSVSEEVCDNGNDSAEGLTWNMPSGADNLRRGDTGQLLV
jgi:hypothetical protein